MNIEADELRQRIVGLLALAYREVHDEVPFSSQQATESLIALSKGLTAYQFTFSGRLESRSDEAIGEMLREVGDAAAKHVGEGLIHALAITFGAFGNFCELIEDAYPDVDLQPLIQKLALRAALPQDTD